MKTASVIIMLNAGHGVPRSGVTPAEAALLVAEHHKSVGSNPLKIVSEGPEIERDILAERNRLVAKFGKARVVAMFPGGKPNLPDDFNEAVTIGLETSMPEQQFINGQPPAGEPLSEPASTGDE